VYLANPGSPAPPYLERAFTLGVKPTAGSTPAFTSGAVVADFNDDHDLDLYLGRPKTDQFLYRNMRQDGATDPPASRTQKWVDIDLETWGIVEVHNSHIFKNGTYSINCSQPEEFGLNIHDMTGNYWGTTSPDTVADWIWDQNDDPANFSIVNYLPMANGPVSTEDKSFGSIKAMFR
jgi:hypothetical protein